MDIFITMSTQPTESLDIGNEVIAYYVRWWSYYGYSTFFIRFGYHPEVQNQNQNLLLDLL